MATIGLDLGGTKMAAGLFSAEGGLLTQDTVLLDGRSGPDVGALVVDQAAALLDQATAEGVTVEAVGVSVPGICHAADGTVWAPNIPGWERYPLGSELQGAVGRRVATTIDSDRACSILGETWVGAAQGRSHAVFLAVGTGIGAGIMIEGTVVRGSRDVAGAVGWMALERPFRSEHAACGCFEWQASGEGLVRFARHLLAEDPKAPSRLRSLDDDALSTSNIFAAHDEGDPVAERVLDNAVECWGMAVANLVSVFDPEIIVLGGGVFGPAVSFLPRIRAEAERWAQPISMARVEIVASTLGGGAALWGAGRLALAALGPSAGAVG